MSGIVGIAKPGNRTGVKHMLDKIAHRGNTTKILETPFVTLGATWNNNHTAISKVQKQSKTNWSDEVFGNSVLVQDDHLLLKRDPLGVTPLYYGWTKDGFLCFASEVKGLLVVTQDVYEIPPGHTFDGHYFTTYSQLHQLPEIKSPSEKIAQGLHRRLESAVESHASTGNVGAWLSGGLDSSIMASLARRYSHPFHTFAVGIPGSPDIEYARIAANYIQSEHHEVLIQIDDLLSVLPEVIYHLESFDAWLVRSSILNYLVARLAAEFVPSVFSGEGADELFAGYEYLKLIDPTELAEELINITSGLHNTALQRVDRCASAHGTVAHVCFLDPAVVDYALRIPTKYKIHNGVEKWILRQAVINDLPDVIINRRKSKFWQGAGVQELLAMHAEEQISDADFAKERSLHNGWKLNTKEELMYYRIFRGHFNEFDDLSWMGRSKGYQVN